MRRDDKRNEKSQRLETLMSMIQILVSFKVSKSHERCARQFPVEFIRAVNSINYYSLALICLLPQRLNLNTMATVRFLFFFFL